MALERREIYEARVRVKVMSAVVGSDGDGWRELNSVSEDSNEDEVSLWVKLVMDGPNHSSGLVPTLL